jgi:hypothetical protein
MPQYPKAPDLLRQIADMKLRLAKLEQSGRIPDELALFPTALQGMPYEDSTTFQTTWETILTARTATLQLGLVLIGDVVSSTNTGGDWQVLLNTNVAASGTVPATFSYVFPALSLDLTPYLATSPATGLKVEVQTRRTAGATTGGKASGGGSIGVAPRYARLL